MRILIINPNSDQTTEVLLQRTAEHFLQERTAVETISITSAPRLIVTYADQAASVPELIKLSGSGEISTMPLCWPATEIPIWNWCRNWLEVSLYMVSPRRP